MKQVTIIGVTGSIGERVRETVLKETSWNVTSFSRHANRLHSQGERETIVSGDVYDKAAVVNAVTGADAVVVALTGALDKMAEAIVEAMKEAKTKRLIFVSSMGIYNEIPARIGSEGNLEHNPILTTYRKAADVVEASGLDYTVLRPGWFDNGDTTYTISRKGEPFEGHDISRQAIADFIKLLIESDGLYVHESVGIHRPD